MASKANAVVAGSFRDPSGFVFLRDGVLYRQVNESYREDYLRLMDSGLYKKLVTAGLMIEHEEAAIAPERPEVAFRMLRPDRIPFISFPYEWSFSQLKAAALATLQIQEIALRHGMILKDASAYNLQFRDGKPILIDTLSFTTYREGEVWIAYRQFCQHFLAPLALMALVDVRLGLLLREFIDGIPLDLASRLLPMRSRCRISLLFHIHLHAKSQARYSNTSPGLKPGFAGKVKTGRKVSLRGIQALIASLSSGIRRLQYKPDGTEWSNYYDDTNYTTEGMQSKAALVSEFISRSRPRGIWDFGGNTGVFSRIGSERGIPTVSFDGDPAAIEKSYRISVAKRESRLLPLVLDLTNPSPAIGWNNEERESLIQRGPVDMAMALALIHHLTISNNVPLERTADFFSRLCRSLIIEFVPKSDSQVQRLLALREDIFPEYTKEGFERAFQQFFSIADSKRVAGSERILYLMNKKQ